jgi:hypothetical protein
MKEKFTIQLEGYDGWRSYSMGGQWSRLEAYAAKVCTGTTLCVAPVVGADISWVSSGGCDGSRPCAGGRTCPPPSDSVIGTPLMRAIGDDPVVRAWLWVSLEP